MRPQINKETREIRLLEALEIARVFDVSETTLRRRIAKDTPIKRGGHKKRVVRASQMATAVLQELQGLLGTQETQETEETQGI